jgi:hypothetical protein
MRFRFFVGFYGSGCCSFLRLYVRLVVFFDFFFFFFFFFFFCWLLPHVVLRWFHVYYVVTFVDCYRYAVSPFVSWLLRSRLRFVVDLRWLRVWIYRLVRLLIYVYVLLPIRSVTLHGLRCGYVYLLPLPAVRFTR